MSKGILVGSLVFIILALTGTPKIYSPLIKSNNLEQRTILAPCWHTPAAIIKDNTLEGGYILRREFTGINYSIIGLYVLLSIAVCGTISAVKGTP